MNLIINGKPHKYREKATVQNLLRSMKIDCRQVAVMVNDEVISRKKFSSVGLKANDRVEILTFAGGG